MGRGRAKAKQTRVARELKYNSPATDLEALQRELSGCNVGSPTAGNGHGDNGHSDNGHSDGSHSDSARGDSGHSEDDRAEETYSDEDDVYRR